MQVLSKSGHLTSYKDKSSFQELCYGIWAQIEFKYQGLTETLDHVLHQMFEMIPLQPLDHKILKCQEDSSFQRLLPCLFKYVL